MIQWSGTKAESILIPHELLGEFLESFRGLKVKLENTNVEMLGDYSWKDNDVVFRPAIAFTRGLKYEVFFSGKLIANITIPFDENAKPPHVVSIYPSADTLPENLLKFYIEFSKPMQEGHSIENVVMLKNQKDTVSVFLDLQQELWNKEGTILTLWLDPGRIKRGLQPNEKIGNPLQQGEEYLLSIIKGWRDAEGLELEHGYRHFFMVGARDSISPSIKDWQIGAPPAGGISALEFISNEPLDYMLLKNAIRIVDSNGNSVAGVIAPQFDEREISFLPRLPWIKGNYTLEVEARLEDLAGNNLNRLFDEDISKKKNTEQKPIHQKSFTIK